MRNNQEPKFVILESPYKGNVEQNVAYAERAMRDSLYRGEAPFASHLLYPEFLDDNDPVERKMGIEAGLAIGRFALATVVYTDLGVSEGMAYGIQRAELENRPVEFRTLDNKRSIWE